ncbi:MAG: hypothetical protein U0798_21590 [Gemmataceae bacterium]
MQLIHPDILAEAHGLSVGAAGFALLVGILLWGLGWRWHRFWIVFGVTLTAGLIGLNAGQTVGGQVLVVGILLACAAGLMALEIARVLAFFAGGVAAWIAVQSILPAAREMWAVFLCGGLLGLMLYRLWAMMLTSTAGVLLASHAILMMGEVLMGADAVTFAKKHAVALNATVIVLAFLGVIIQHQIAKFDLAQEKAAKHHAKEHKKRKHEEEDEEEEIVSPWWRRKLSGKAA